MSLFTKLFGKNAKEKPPTPQEAIQRIKEVEELLEKRSSLIEKKIQDETNTARQNATKNKRLALMALKRKKRLETQLNQIDGTLTTLEYQREVLENASANAEVFKVMSTATKAFKGANNNMDIDAVHNLMDDLSEQKQMADEISQAISNPVGFDQDVDEDELLKELEELQDQDVEEGLLNIPSAPSIKLPDVPADRPTASKKQEEDDDLRKMADWANS